VACGSVSGFEPIKGTDVDIGIDRFDVSDVLRGHSKTSKVLRQDAHNGDATVQGFIKGEGVDAAVVQGVDANVLAGLGVRPEGLLPPVT
jgi:hypothetical protein